MARLFTFAPCMICILMCRYCETDDRPITGMELFLYFINNANLMTQELLLATFMQPNSVIHQPNL